MRVAAHTVLGDIRVIAIDQKLDAGATPDGTPSKPATTVTLEVTGEQAERVVVAGRIGKLSLVVRSAEASNVSENPNHVTWGSDVSPAMAAAPLPNAPNAETLNSTVRVHRGSADAKEFHF
jgi:pilus assembly protein CpaB